MIASFFQNVLDSYLSEGSRTVDSSTGCYGLIKNKIPNYFDKLIKRKDIYISGSTGQGNRTAYPWVCIMNRKLTTSPQRSIYIAYLFKKDMTGFYLTLNQGITYFQANYKNHFSKAMKVAEYFRNEIKDTSFSKKPIYIGGIRPDKGFGYERTTIFSKYYHSNHFNDDEIKSDLKLMLELYDEVIYALHPKSYEEAIANILSSPDDVMIAYDEAQEMLRSVLVEPQKQDLTIKDLLEIKPNRNKVRRLKALTEDSNRKLDYIRIAQENARIGVLGEQLVLDFEKKRLDMLGTETLLPKWVSIQTDVYGYDIESWNYNKTGSFEKIFIEVKTTVSKYDTDFFVSKNEVERSEEYGDHYWIYRIFDCDSSTPKMYRVNGSIHKNFTIHPLTYCARLKVLPEKNT